MINRLIFRWTTWQTSRTQSQRNLQLSRGTWYLLWQFHIALSWSQTKGWFHLYSPFLGSSLWWKEITGNPSLGLEVLEAETRCTNPALFGPLGKNPSHHSPGLPVSCCPSGSSVSTRADSQPCVCLGSGRGEEREGQEAQRETASGACPGHWQDSLGSALGLKCSPTAPAWHPNSCHLHVNF